MTRFLMKRDQTDSGVPLSRKYRVSALIAGVFCALLGWATSAASQEGLPVVVTEVAEQPILRQLQVQQLPRVHAHAHAQHLARAEMVVVVGRFVE